jgi:17 kDa outer membrane surface antigen
MRSSLLSLAASVATALLFAFLALATVTRTAAHDVGPVQPPCSCQQPHDAPKASPRPKFADYSRELDTSDEIATLEAIRVALTEVADGSSFVWHRGHGRLSGVIQPTSSFKDAAGRVCRHIVLVLTTGVRSGRVEGVACRLADGRWQLDG